MPYALADSRKKFRLASENPLKEDVVARIMRDHEADQILIIGTYVDQLKGLSERLGLPLLTGSTSQSRRDELFHEFKRGRIKALAVSKVANFSVDLPSASVAIQISGTFGSRQEEAQRLGRILRAKSCSTESRVTSV